jgi:Fe2+ or Zn2+ uptake regulation protein
MRPSTATVEQWARDFVVRCRERGLSVTQQRLVIFRELALTEEHPTAEELYRAIRKRYPTISLSTVYKNLEVLEKNGFVSRTPTRSSIARYDANQDPHHHLVCRLCDRVEDWYTDKSVLETAGKGIRGFAVESCQIHFYGVCGECREKSA